MNKNLDLTEILKNCPVGTKFYSSYLGKDVIFIEIYDNHIKCEYSSQIDSLNCSIQFRKDGSLYPGGECMLFPSKDQRDWSKWQRPFIDGDILVSITDKIFIFSDTKIESFSKISYCTCHIVVDKINKNIVNCNFNDFGPYVSLCRYATEEEKQLLFDVIKDKGYRWNVDTKTLEKIKKEKFDPKTLQPFDKVLARQFKDRPWIADFHSYYDVCRGQSVGTGEFRYYYCIPYNEDTKHLLGSSNEAPEFYRYWEN